MKPKSGNRSHVSSGRPAPSPGPLSVSLPPQPTPHFPSHLPLHLIDAFVVSAQSRGLVEAARRLGITQPTLSRQLQQLEELVPLPLFHFNGRNKALTHYGQTLYQALQGRFADLNSYIHQVNARFVDPRSATLRITGRRDILHPYLKKLEFPGALHFIFMSGEGALEALLSRKADVCINQRLPDSTDVVAKPVFKRGMSLLVPKKFVPVKPKLQNVGPWLARTPCLSFAPDHPFFVKLAGHVGLAPRQMRITRVCSEWSVLGELAEAGLGWTLLPTAQETNSEFLWKIEIPESVIERIQFYILYLKDFDAVPWFQEFVQSWRGELNGSSRSDRHSPVGKSDPQK